MKPNNTKEKPTNPEHQSGEGLGMTPRCASLRMPRRETEKWKRLSGCLDVIASQIDYPATHQGFCRRKVKVMDAALVEIIRAAQEARSLIQHNAKAEPRRTQDYE